MAEPPSSPERPPLKVASSASPPTDNSRPTNSNPAAAEAAAESLALPTTSGGTFSKLLAGAMSSVTLPILAVPVDAAPIPVVAVPCIIAPATLLDSPGFKGQFAMTHQAVLATVTAQAQLQLQLQAGQAGQASASTDASTISSPHASVSPATTLSLPQKPPPALEDRSCKLETEPSPSPRQKPMSPHVVLRENSSDGYSWRKYGQKQVKSSESSRSYYRCASAHCSIKKKVQHFQDGRVIEIVYKGCHNHDPPRKTRFSRERKSPPTGTHLESGNVELSSDEINRTDALSSKPEESQGNSSREKQVHCSSDCEEDAGVSAEDHGHEPDHKKRVTESSTPSSTQQLKIVREPKVVMQSRSCTGSVSDGYKWRKYGQKLVKGNPNPRSYYRCTQYRCPVRKHVQRSSDDSQLFLVTYEGKHNHEQPSSRNGSICSPIPLATPATPAVTPERPKKEAVDSPEPKPRPEKLPVTDVERKKKRPRVRSEAVTESNETH